jgi:hypothetical protein
MSTVAEQLNEAQQLHQEKLRYIEEQLAANVLSEECFGLIQNHRVVGSGLRNEHLGKLGPYPETLEEHEGWNIRKAEVEAQVEAHLAAVRDREGLKEAWETWCYQEKLKALREMLIHEQQQQHHMAGIARVPGYDPVQQTEDCSVVNLTNQKPSSTKAEQLNEAQQLQLEQLHYIEEQLAAKVLSEGCLRLIQHHRVVGSRLRKGNLARLGPYPRQARPQNA